MNLRSRLEGLQRALGDVYADERQAAFAAFLRAESDLEREAAFANLPFGDASYVREAASRLAALVGAIEASYPSAPESPRE